MLPNVLVFTTSGTYVPSANIVYVQVEAVGGGGGGGGGLVNAASSANAGGGKFYNYLCIHLVY